MERFKRRINALFGVVVLIAVGALIASSQFLSLEAGELGKEIPAGADSAIAKPSNYTPMADTLAGYLKSGKPTLAYVYYSVACSCTAAHCAIAEAAIDSAINENGLGERINLLKVDGYNDESADSVFKVDFIPLVVYYNDKGKEASRIDWDISKAMIEDLIAGKAVKKDVE